MAVRFVLNGERIQVDDVDPHLTLLNWLRAVGRTGTKEGCSEGECGACAVAVIRRDGRGQARYEGINSCLVPLPAVDGQSIVTVEGVAGAGAGASGELHPVQQGMIDHGGSQCGYCTPGFVVSLFCEYYRPGRGQFDPESVSGNLCRCTGYRPILDAGRALPQPAAGDPHLAALATSPAGPSPADHTHGGRRFVRPTRLTELFDCLAADPTATLIGGGTDLMVRANQSYERFGTLVSLEALPELRIFELRPQALVIGAGLSLSEIEDRLTQEPALALADLPVLHELMRLFSSRLIRNRATLGGNLATASPIGDSLPVLLALDAELEIAGPDGERRIAVRDFFRAYRRTALKDRELIVSVHLPRPFAAQQRFYKVSKRILDDISTVAAAFALDLGADGRVQRLRLAFGGIAATPIQARALEDLALGLPWTTETLQRLLPEIAKVGTPMSDHRGSAAYRRAMTTSLLEKFFWETAGDRGAAAP